MGSALEGAPVIDYTTPGSRASRLQRWDKLRTDAGNLAEARYHQALRYGLSSVLAHTTMHHELTTPCPVMKPCSCLAGICSGLTQTARRSGKGLLLCHLGSCGHCWVTSFCLLQCHTVVPVTAHHQAANAKNVARGYDVQM